MNTATKMTQQDLIKLIKTNEQLVDILGEEYVEMENIYTLYLEMLSLSEELTRVIRTARMIVFDDNLVLDALEELITCGKDSYLYTSTSAFWHSLACGITTNSSLTFGEFTPHIEIEEYLEQRAGSSTILTPMQVAEEIAALPFYRDFNIIASNFSQHPMCKHNETAQQVYQFIYEEFGELGNNDMPLLATPVAGLVSNMEFWSNEGDAMSRFLSTVKEHDVKWALSNFDWGNGQQPTVFPTLQEIVNASPWGDPS